MRGRDVSDPGVPTANLAAPGADLRFAIPKYKIWRDGLPEREASSAEDVWDEAGDLVTFLLGCSFSWESVLSEAGLVPRQMEQGCNVPMYKTTIPNTPSGPFGGELVVSMRPYPLAALAQLQSITGKYPGAHGAPVHWGCPEDIGVLDIATPDYGEPVEIRDGEVPVFWACGVTPQSALEGARLPLAVTHSPGYMMICDLLEEELLV